MIIRGKDKGETGLIKRVIRSQNRVIVEGKNLVSLSFTQSLHCSLFIRGMENSMYILAAYWLIRTQNSPINRKLG
jgi:hypothetical protein